MLNCLIVGMPNVGKTYFLISFAEYMGLKKIQLNLKMKAGMNTAVNYSLEEARDKLVSDKENYTRDLQYININIRIGKAEKKIKIIDTCGLHEGIHPEQEIRKSMAETIDEITKSNLVLHVIDIKNIYKNNNVLYAVDQMIYNYAQKKTNYVIIVNKIDLKNYLNNLKIIRKKLSSTIIIPVSAFKKKGFDNVKYLVNNYA